MVQVGSLNAGRIVATRVDVGRPVREGQEIAVVAMPREVGSTAVGAAPRMGITGTDDSLVSVYSPLNGIVAARHGARRRHRHGRPADLLPGRSGPGLDPRQHRGGERLAGPGRPGRRDPRRRAEPRLRRPRRRDHAGLAATFSLLPANNASGNFTKVTQYVPVKIVVDMRAAWSCRSGRPSRSGSRSASRPATSRSHGSRERPPPQPLADLAGRAPSRREGELASNMATVAQPLGARRHACGRDLPPASPPSRTTGRR